MPDRDDSPQRDTAEAGADDAALAVVARHALHDEELVAALAAGALEGEEDADERTRARSFVDRCPACRAVHDDVAAIVGATKADARFTAKAPRDFRLSVDDAHRLGGTVITRGPLAAFGRLLAGIARPMGASLAALGLVGVLVGGASMGAMGLGSPASQSGGTTSTVASEAPAAAPSSLEITFASDAPKSSGRNALDAATPESGVDNGPSYANTSAPGPTGWLLIVSVLAIVGGAALFLFGTGARRRGTGAETP